MDSYVLAETFKYLYLLFAEKEDVILDIDDYVFTTEAHLLPLTLSMHNYSANETKVSVWIECNFIPWNLRYLGVLVETWFSRVIGQKIVSQVSCKISVGENRKGL